jgi:hypothetical protein
MGFTFRFGYNIFRIAHLLFASLIYISGAGMELGLQCAQPRKYNPIIKPYCSENSHFALYRIASI